MNMRWIYGNPVGRAGVLLAQKIGVFKMISWYLKTGWSKRMIPGYIERNQIDMKAFEGQTYGSFAEFFGRTRTAHLSEGDPDILMSPCDGLISIYPIAEGMVIGMKGSHYRLKDLVPQEEASAFLDGICLMLRLQASDYHHFCAFDDLTLERTGYIPGMLHSVQPIACEKVPVYRLNRRWWSRLDTVHFGPAIQIEVGAMSVGGVTLAAEGRALRRGEEMGNFELAGSTVILLLTAEVRERLRLKEKFSAAFTHHREIPVVMGEEIGKLKNVSNRTERMTCFVYNRIDEENETRCNE